MRNLNVLLAALALVTSFAALFIIETGSAAGLPEAIMAIAAVLTLWDRRPPLGPLDRKQTAGQ
jgi:hypothetical protein